MSITHLTTDTFTDFTSADTPVLVDFYADWCAPCRKMSAVLDEVSAARPAMPVGKVNVDEEPELARRFGIMSIPTVVFLKDGAEVDRKIGLMPGAVFAAELDKYL